MAKRLTTDDLIKRAWRKMCEAMPKDEREDAPDKPPEEFKAMFMVMDDIAKLRVNEGPKR